MGKFNTGFEFLYQADCPDWFRDAKFGIWSHWGPQSGVWASFRRTYRQDVR